MDMTTAEVGFLTRRKWFSRAFPFVGALMLVMLAGLAVFLYATSPLLVNPLAVVAGIQDGSISESTRDLMATMLPMAILACFAVCASTVGFAFGIAANERKYFSLIDRLQAETGKADK